MSIRRKLLASDPERTPATRNPLLTPGAADTSLIRASDRPGARCGQARSHRTQYPPLHKLCHALVGERDELGSIDYALEEIVVESATYVACASAGLQTDVDSVPYVAGWAGDQDPLQVVAEAAALIDELARLIEDTIAPAEHEDARQTQAAP